MSLKLIVQSKILLCIVDEWLFFILFPTQGYYQPQIVV